MEQLFLALIFILALFIIVNRVRKLFNSECGSECGGECSCCQSSMPQPRRIVEEKARESGF